MIDITPIFAALILLFFGFITYKVWPLIVANTESKDREKILFWTKIAVAAAEQLAKSGAIDRDDRKDHAIKFLQKHGFTVDFDILKEVMEACVNELPPFESKEDEKDEE